MDWRIEMRSALFGLAGGTAGALRLGIRGTKSTPTSGALTVDALVERHFIGIGEADHRSAATMHEALRLLGGRPAHFLETGTAAWGTQSTLLLASYVEAFGGAVLTIDTRVEPALTTFRAVPRSVRYLFGDSARVLSRPYAQTFAESADLVYLDSWDVDPDDPYASAAHGLAEFTAIADCLKPNALVLIDDTPATLEGWSQERPSMVAFSETWGVPMGKGSLVRKLIDGSPGFQIIMHDYQLLIRKT